MSKNKPHNLTKPGIINAHFAFEKGYNKGYQDGLEKGFKESCFHMTQRMYAAILVAETEINGSDQDKCIELLNRVNTILMDALTDDELASRVMDEVGVEIDWGQPVELAQPKPPTKGN